MPPPRGKATRYRRTRRKPCAFCVEKVVEIDYKAHQRLRRFVTDRGKIKPRKSEGTCARHQRLKEEWEKYLAQTETHVQMLEEICAVMRIDRHLQAPGRRVVRAVTAGLLEAMKVAKAGGDARAAEIV